MVVFLGDSKWRKRVRQLLEPEFLKAEIETGFDSEISFCCIFYYIVATRLYLVLNHIKVLEFFYPDGQEFFDTKGYYRCIICFIQNNTSKVNWNDRSEYYYYYGGNKFE